MAKLRERRTCRFLSFGILEMGMRFRPMVQPRSEGPEFSILEILMGRRWVLNVPIMIDRYKREMNRRDKTFGWDTRPARNDSNRGRAPSVSVRAVANFQRSCRGLRLFDTKNSPMRLPPLHMSPCSTKNNAILWIPYFLALTSRSKRAHKAKSGPSKATQTPNGRHLSF